MAENKLKTDLEYMYRACGGENNADVPVAIATAIPVNV